MNHQAGFPLRAAETKSLDLRSFAELVRYTSECTSCFVRFKLSDAETVAVVGAAPPTAVLLQTLNDLSCKFVSFGLRRALPDTDTLAPFDPPDAPSTSCALFARFRAAQGEVSLLAWWRTTPIETTTEEALFSTIKSLWRSLPDIKMSIGIDKYQPLLDALRCGTFFVDANLVLLSSNASGREMLNRRNYVRVADGKLDFIDPDSRQIVREELVRMMADATRGRSSALSLSTEGQQHMAFIIRLNPGTAAFLLVLNEFDDAAAARKIVSVFGLTRTEARVLPCLLKAISAADIARTQNLSEATVRTYTRRIMSKINISRRADLYRLVGLIDSPFCDAVSRASNVLGISDPGRRRMT